MASFVGNIFTKNYQNLIIGFQVTVNNVGDVFETQCIKGQCYCYGMVNYNNKRYCKLRDV